MLVHNNLSDLKENTTIKKKHYTAFEKMLKPKARIFHGVSKGEARKTNLHL